MKKILYTTAMAALLCLGWGCDEKADLPVLTDQEYPRILGRWPETDPTTGTIGEFGAKTGVTFTIELQFTPTNLCEGVWYLDGVEYSHGTVFTYLSGQPVTHDLKVVVTTDKYTTTREAKLVVTD